MKADYCQDKKIYGKEIETNANEVCEEVKNILDMLKANYFLNADQCFDIKVILCELLQNAIKHGNGYDLNKKIHLDLWYKEESKVLGITVKDQGCGFVPPINLTYEKMSECDPINSNECGRGLCIVNELCDCMEFNSTGNAVTVLKKL